MSTTSGVAPSPPIPTRSHACAIARMISVVASIPVLTASSPMSVATASIWAATVSGGTVCTPVTPTVFCTVTAVTATQPCTPHAANARRSAATPAPPPESVPAIVMTRGGVVPTVRSPIRRLRPQSRADGSRLSELASESMSQRLRTESDSLGPDRAQRRSAMSGRPPPMLEYGHDVDR